MGLIATAGCRDQPMKVVLNDADQGLTFHALDEAQDVHATVLDGDGVAIAHPHVQWYSINPQIAEVTLAGRVVPRMDGKTTVVARCGFAQHQLPVTVQVYAFIQPSARTIQLREGSVQHFTAQVFDAMANEISDAAVSWSSRDPRIAEVDEDGTIIALLPGITTVTVSAKHATATVLVQVLPAEDEPST
jgi:hypothetical protein